MKIIIGADHAGVRLKDAIVEHLRSAGHEVEDVGTHGDDSVDYPDFAQKVAEEVSIGAVERGILTCGSGVGMAIAANKLPGVRAVAVYSDELARLSREHNDTNVMSLGERMTPVEDALAMVDTWLSTPFAGGRHEGRVDKLHELESKSGPCC